MIIAVWFVPLGTTGACWGEHSSAVSGSVLFQEQALRRGVALRSALLWLQWCKCLWNPQWFCCKVKDYTDCSIALQAREEGKALLRQISQVRDQVETPSADLFAPLSNNNTPVRRVSPLNLISFTPWYSPDLKMDNVVTQTFAEKLGFSCEHFSV